MKSSLADIIKTVSRNTTVLDELKNRNGMMDEVINNIYQRVEDMSKKFDEVLNMGVKMQDAEFKKSESKSPSKKGKSPPKKGRSPPKKVAKKKSKPATNIMAFFKSKYMEDPSYFSNVLEENQDIAILEEKREEIAAKKPATREKAKATFVYKSLTDVQKNKVREMMADEIESAAANTNDDIEKEPVSD
jgi:hypothetical protein